MSPAPLIAAPTNIEMQPPSVLGLAREKRDALIVSTRLIDGQWIVISRYGDDTWHFIGHPTNTAPSEQSLEFGTIPEAFRATMKAIVYRYIRRGREGKKRPSARSIVKLHGDARPFLRHLERLNITRFADVTPIACTVYVQACKQHRQLKGRRRAGKPLKASYLGHRFGVIEALYELSQYTDDAMATHPWPGTSSTHLAGLTGRGTGNRGGKTPLMPDEVFTTLFQRAWSLVENGDKLLDIRDEGDKLKKAFGRNQTAKAMHAQLRYVRTRGWSGLLEFHKALLALRTACYVVVASLSGCRNHELAFIQSGACYSSKGVPGENEGVEIYWWMRSQSTKTNAGHTEWMIPEAAVTALRVMERWAKPYQALIATEIASRRAADPLDPQIAEAQRHRKAVFLGAVSIKANQVRTLTGQGWNKSLKAFAKTCGLSWDLTTHQFRRKFANYAARSQFGDLRYLREHFKHWSMDMTLGYALNESQELALYIEIQDELDEIKAGVVDTWLKPDAPLAGGYGTHIVTWRGSKAITLFKDHKHMVRSLAESTAIRSNGHAWCTADDNLCVGNDIERTRCGNCNNAVIGVKHASLYKGLYDHLKEVLDCDDVGSGGLKLVRRDMDRCRKVLLALGQADPEENVK